MGTLSVLVYRLIDTIKEKGLSSFTGADLIMFALFIGGIYVITKKRAKHD